MKFSLRWLQDYITLTVSPDELFERLTLAGTEVEHVEVTGLESPHVVVAQILSSVPHPNADRLRVCRVNDGKQERQIVCGAKNYKDGDRVPLALPGAKLPGNIVIKESKLRGELSQGMLCSAKELSYAADAEGLMLLPADAPLGKLLHEYLPGDTRFEIEITPNRPDLLSYAGLAREIAAIGCGTLKPLDLAKIQWPTAANPWKVSLPAPDRCPFYSASVLKVKVGPSPDWLREKVEAMGHRSINNVVDITNFVLWELGQPLHAFDAAKLKGKTIAARLAQPEEKFAALDDKTYALLADDLVIADESGPVALAGVMGGKESGVTEQTTEIVLESAWFAPSTVRRTSRRLGLISDSSYCFERRVDPAGVLRARDRAIQLLQQIAEGELLAQAGVEGKLPESHGPIALRHERVAAILGVEISREQVAQWLQSLGLKSIEQFEAQSVWQPPTFRPDLEREIDLIEEVARLHGLAGVPSRLPAGVAPESESDKSYDRVKALRSALAARGWNECLTDALIDEKVLQGVPALELANPLNEQYSHLRPHLRSSLLAVASRNLARGNAVVRLFEIGRTFAENGQSEPLRLGLLAAGFNSELNWLESQRPADFFDLKGTIDWLQETWGVADVVSVGKIPAAELKVAGIKTPVFYAEFELKKWLGQRPAPKTYKELPTFPSVRRDVAVVVERSLPHASIEQKIREASPTQLQAIELFDVFLDNSGEKIAADKKSLAYSLTYRASDRTLTEKEVNEWQDKVKSVLKGSFNCSFRE